MIIPDFRNFMHSAKGSSWDDHKYVKKIDGVYYYPAGYEDGRTINDLKSSKSEEDSKNDVEKLANETIRGDYGNGQDRKNILGDKYEEVQKRVNEILGGSANSKKVSDVNPESIRIAEEAAKKAIALVKAYRNKK